MFWRRKRRFAEVLVVGDRDTLLLVARDTGWTPSMLAMLGQSLTEALGIHTLAIPPFDVALLARPDIATWGEAVNDVP